MSNNSAYKRASSIMQKAKGPKWKRELVSDHKFDFIDVEEFRDYTCLLTIRYFVLLCSVLISFATYGADIWSAGILLIYDVRRKLIFCLQAHVTKQQNFLIYHHSIGHFQHSLKFLFILVNGFMLDVLPFHSC